ncbi:hypothetical protein AAES_11785 [Amazona aestiva]|uniref:Uncharacterized protein n=1 Tax=Amazona aestiva TaxID=12930 RepID=A0A0Q3X9T7_AMAAE|nr:hypothetical protein AAES_11785 [Amazona aestiva]
MIPTSSQRMVLGEEEGGSRSPGSDEGHIASFFTTQLRPSWIRKKVQALYQVLDHPLVYQDAKAQLDCVQKPHVPREKHARMPGAPAWKTKAEILEGILLAMRNTQTFTEVPLGDGQAIG